MPQKSRWTVPIPEVSMASFMFGSPTAKLPSGLAFADAEDPENLSMTWEEFRLWSQRFAAGLRAAGLKRGERLVIASPNNVAYPVVFAGVAMAGGVYSSANPKAVARELAYQLQVAEAKFLLVTEENVDVGLEAADLVKLSRDRVFMFDDTPLAKNSSRGSPSNSKLRHWGSLFSSEAVGRSFHWDNLSPESSKKDDVALIFSSGTTGLPKGVQISHYSVIANAVQTDHVMGLDPELNTHEKSAARSRWLCCLPLYHGLGLCYYFHISVFRRIPTYIMKKYDTDMLLAHIQRFKITELHLVPPMIVAMVKHPGLQKGQFDISSVNKTFSCAAPLGAQITLQYEALWPKGHLNVQQGLASTETACNTLGWDPTVTAAPGSVGEPMPNCEIKLVDEEDNEVKQGEAGEILVRSPNRMTAYYNNPKATSETLLADGWLRTGDVARISDEGWYYIVDRKKEMIKVKGVQIAPAELEALLLDHPGVLDAGVIGMRNEYDDEQPRAFIVKTPGAEVTEQDIIQYMAGKVSGIKRLTGGVSFVDNIPKTPSGKILRRQIREAVARQSKL